MVKKKEISENSVLFEMHPLGNAVKVVAIDQISGTEVSVVVPKGTAPFTMKAQAFRKLVYVINKGKDSGDADDEADDDKRDNKKHKIDIET